MNPLRRKTPFGTGARQSHKDPRTVSHETVTMAGAPLVKGGTAYNAPDIRNQRSVGICTAISLVQNREKANGRRYSPDFQYLLQKKYYDGNWYEGSSILQALKVGKAYGFLPLEKWTYTTENDRDLPYSQYIAKLRAIPDAEIQRLIGLCRDKIPGYASVNIDDAQAVALAINQSHAGILCRYEVGTTWWLPTWFPKDINPLRKPSSVVSGHAIVSNMFDYTTTTMLKLANTWSTDWCLQGCADINWSTYRMTEAWTILDFTPDIPPYKFENNLWFGMQSEDVKQLQKRLGVNPTGLFWFATLAAVIKYQRDNEIYPPFGFVGPITRASLNNG